MSLNVGLEDLNEQIVQLRAPGAVAAAADDLDAAMVLMNGTIVSVLGYIASGEDDTVAELNIRPAGGAKAVVGTVTLDVATPVQMASLSNTSVAVGDTLILDINDEGTDAVSPGLFVLIRR